MAGHASTLKTAALAGLALLALSSSPSLAGSVRLLAIPDLPDLKDRVRAFRQALREVTVDPPGAEEPHPAGDLLMLESRFHFADQLDRPGLDEPSGEPGRRDLVFEEQWLLAGREDDHETAARHWLGGRLKGKRHHRSTRRAVLEGQLAWDHGPLVGVGHGPVSLRAGSGQWRLQWAKRWSRSNGPWRARVSVGEEDGEFKAAFLIGRTLLDSYGR